MLRRIIEIDSEKCNGCGLCVSACHEGAIAISDGKARLLRDDYCDGLGDCLPACPSSAISFVEREALVYNEAAVLQNKNPPLFINWPIQLKLAPLNAPYFNNADLLISADCCAYSFPSFQQLFLRNKVRLIACPKLDAVDYSEKLSLLFNSNNFNSVTVLRMEVPCCGGIEYAVKSAIANSANDIPLEIVTVTIDGKILNQ